MLEVMDYSNRRGVIVPLLPAIHAILTENAAKDEMADIAPPPHIILWKQAMNKALTDIKRRWLFVLDGFAVAGFVFYHIDKESLYIDEMQTAWMYRHNEAVLTLLLDKFQSDRGVAACVDFYLSERIKKDENTELLASVGFKEAYDNGYQPAGSLTETVNALRLRYGRRG